MRLAAIDLDGTLLGSDGTLSPRTKAAVAGAARAGIDIVLVTARGPRTVGDLAAELGIAGEAICSNGGMLLDQLFASRPLDELASYRTPITGYYLCGSGTHPGGGVMGASGHNAAMTALFDTGTGPDPANLALAAPVRAGSWPGRAVDRVMAGGAGRKAGYQLARQPLLRWLTNFAARARR